MMEELLTIYREKKNLKILTTLTIFDWLMFYRFKFDWLTI